MPSICKFCKKTLMVKGLDRANGKESFSFEKWEKNEYHKKCLRELKTIEYCIILANS